MNFSSNFTPIFLDAQYTIADRITTAPGFIIAPLNLVTCTVFAFLTFDDWKRFHFNFCMLRLHMLVAFYLVACSHLIILFTMWLEAMVTPRYAYFLYFACIVGGSFATDLLRFLWIAFSIERCFATFYSHAYEKKRYTSLSILLTLYAYGTPTMLAYLKYSVNVNYYCVYAFSFIVDVIGIISIYQLQKLNKKRRKIDLDSSDITLTQRYQIVENIRVLQIIFPIMATGIFFTSAGTIVRILTTKIEPLMFLFRYVIMIYYTSFNIYAFISISIWLKSDPLYRRKLISMYKKIFNSRTADQQASNTNSNELMFINVEGKFVYMGQNTDAHFNSLGQFWNN